MHSVFLTVNIPTFGSIVQKGKFAACASSDPTSALKSVDFPTLGRPTIPVCNFMDTDLCLLLKARFTEDSPRGEVALNDADLESNNMTTNSNTMIGQDITSINQAEINRIY